MIVFSQCRNMITIFFVFFILLISSSLIFVASPHDTIIYVDDDGGADYTRIQDAINASSEGDMIFVYSGSYDESVIINKSITLIGENKDTTLIDGGQRSDVITIEADNVSFSHFTIQNSTNNIRKGWWKAGIRITSSNVNIEDNIIQNNLLGIFAKRATNLSIKGNFFFNDSLVIYPYGADYNPRPALKKTHFIHRITNNFVNDKPLLYIVDESDVLISSDIGQVILINCTNVSVKNMSISSADFPLLFVFCRHCSIENVSFFDNEGECTFLDSDENNVCGNRFHNNFHGLLLDYGSEANTVSGNVFFNNRFCGVICEYFSNNNMFFQNDFVANRAVNAFLINAFKNRWENNFWSDWIGLKKPFFQLFPKLIRGTLFEANQNIPSLFNIDFNPRVEPYHY